jgi:hypothetical protein
MCYARLPFWPVALAFVKNMVAFFDRAEAWHGMDFEAHGNQFAA